MSLIRKSPDLFGCRDFSVIDRDDQLSIFKFIRAASKLAKEPKLPRAGDLLDAYSFTRNIIRTLGEDSLKPPSFHRRERIKDTRYRTFSKSDRVDIEWRNGRCSI